MRDVVKAMFIEVTSDSIAASQAEQKKSKRIRKKTMKVDMEGDEVGRREEAHLLIHVIHTYRRQHPLKVKTWR